MRVGGAGFSSSRDSRDAVQRERTPSKARVASGQDAAHSPSSSVGGGRAGRGGWGGGGPEGQGGGGEEGSLWMARSPRLRCVSGSGFGVQGVGFRVQGLGLRV